MEALSEVLRAVKLTGAVFLNVEFRVPWCIAAQGSWRLALAASRLRSGSTSLARIADEVGYESEAAFNRAFKREFGMPPARWRRQDGAVARHPAR